MVFLLLAPSMTGAACTDVWTAECPAREIGLYVVNVQTASNSTVACEANQKQDTIGLDRTAMKSGQREECSGHDPSDHSHSGIDCALRKRADIQSA